jgi:ankyrin repeat protein
MVVKECGMSILIPRCKEIIFAELKCLQLHNPKSLCKIYKVIMKLKLFFVVTLSAFACSLNACPNPSNASLTHQYETGALQWQIARKEIDPNTLIHQAILENSSEEIINFLLSHGVNVDYPDQNGMSPLTMAVLNRSTNAVKLLLAHGANPNPTVKWNNMSLLQLALTMRDANSTKLLVEYGADVKVRDQSGNALSTAISLSNTYPQWREIAILMINKGADMHFDGNDSPLMQAIYIAQQRGNRSLLELIVQKGVNIDQIQKFNGKEWNTPLLQAIHVNDLSLVEFLINSGADVNKAINYGGCEIRTPLKYALANGKVEIVQYLLQQGARA